MDRQSTDTKAGIKLMIRIRIFFFSQSPLREFDFLPNDFVLLPLPIRSSLPVFDDSFKCLDSVAFPTHDFRTVGKNDFHDNPRRGAVSRFDNVK